MFRHGEGKRVNLFVLSKLVDPVHRVDISLPTTLRERNYADDERLAFILENCDSGMWSYATWTTVVDRKENCYKSAYYFEVENDAIYFKMRFG
jgi:hypothetical protein